MPLINKNFPIYIQIKRTALLPRSFKDISATTKVSLIDGGNLIINDGESIKIAGGVQDTRIVGKFTDQNAFLLAMSEIIEYYKKKGVSDLGQILAYASMSDGSDIDVIYDVNGRKFFHRDDRGADGRLREDNDNSEFHKKLYQIKSIGGLLDYINEAFGRNCAVFNLFVHYDEPPMDTSKNRIGSIIEITCRAENKSPDAIEGYDIDGINEAYANLTFKDNYFAKEFLHEMNQSAKNVILSFDKERADYRKNN